MLCCAVLRFAVLPDSEIVPTGVEQVAALKEFAFRLLAGYKRAAATL